VRRVNKRRALATARGSVEPGSKSPTDVNPWSCGTNSQARGTHGKRHMTPTQENYYANAVREAEEAFESKMSEIAASARNALLQYFADNRFTFISGNGTWHIEDTKKPKKHSKRFVNDEDLLPAISRTLNLEFASGGHLGRHLGLYMEPITRKDWKD